MNQSTAIRQNTRQSRAVSRPFTKFTFPIWSNSLTATY